MYMRNKKKIMFNEILKTTGLVGLIMIILFIIFLPLICTIILGMYIAGVLNLSGITWWAFMIIFYIIIMSVIGKLTS